MTIPPAFANTGASVIATIAVPTPQGGGVDGVAVNPVTNAVAALCQRLVDAGLTGPRAAGLAPLEPFIQAHAPR